MEIGIIASLILASYLIGSMSSAIIVCKLWGLGDPRASGSKNPGATNVLRLGGKLPAIITLFGDAIKGFVPVVAVKFGFVDFFTLNIEWVLSGVLLAAILGHLFPVFFQFKGGKGVATSLGGIFGLSPWLGLSFVTTWVLVAMITKYSSLSALLAILVVPVVSYFYISQLFVPALLLVAFLLFLRHKDNIKRLLNGQESKIGKK